MTSVTGPLFNQEEGLQHPTDDMTSFSDRALHFSGEESVVAPEEEFDRKVLELQRKNDELMHEMEAIKYETELQKLKYEMRLVMVRVESHAKDRLQVARRDVEHLELLNELQIGMDSRSNEELPEFCKKLVTFAKQSWDDNQRLEIEIEQLKGTSQVSQHMMNSDDLTEDKMEALRKELREREKEFEDLDQVNQALLVKERKSNDELCLARKELLTALRDTLNGGTEIGIKRMGDLDPKPFQIAYRRKFPAVKDEMNAMELFTRWGDHLRNSEWYPFNLVKVEGKTNEVHVIIDEDDELLQELKTKWGPEVYDAVTIALLELNQYSPSGRFIVEEFWNFKEKRSATLGEVIQFIFK